MPALACWSICSLSLCMGCPSFEYMNSPTRAEKNPLVRLKTLRKIQIDILVRRISPQFLHFKFKQLYLQRIFSGAHLPSRALEPCLLWHGRALEQSNDRSPAASPCGTSQTIACQVIDSQKGLVTELGTQQKTRKNVTFSKIL